MNQTAQQIQPSELDKLAFELEEAKRIENQAKLKRIEIEERIQAQLPSENEGTETSRETFYSVSVRYGLTRKILIDELNKLYNDKSLHSTLATIFVPQPKIDLAALRKIEKNEPETYARIAKAISTKPSKPSVSIKRLN